MGALRLLALCGLVSIGAHLDEVADSFARAYAGLPVAVVYRRRDGAEDPDGDATPFVTQPAAPGARDCWDATRAPAYTARVP